MKLSYKKMKLRIFYKFSSKKKKGFHEKNTSSKVNTLEFFKQNMLMSSTFFVYNFDN